MEIIGGLIFVALMFLFCVAYAHFFKISVGIWIPNIAKKNWVELANSRVVMRWFWKWVVPAWVVMVPTIVLVAAFEIAMK